MIDVWYVIDILYDVKIVELSICEIVGSGA